jgi:hypothetical protein
MLELAKASCGSAACHGIWVDPETGDLLVVGDRTAVAPAGDGGPARTVVEVATTVYEQASRTFRLAAGSTGDRFDDLLLGEAAGESVRVVGESVPTPASGIGVGPHEELIVVRRVDPALVRALSGIAD